MIRKTTRVALLCLAAALVPSCGDDETVTIIQTLPALPGSTGSGGFGSFGGAVVPGMVFTADRNQVDVVELWATDIAGSVLVNLSGPLATSASSAGRPTARASPSSPTRSSTASRGSSSSPPSAGRP